MTAFDQLESKALKHITKEKKKHIQRVIMKYQTKSNLDHEEVQCMYLFEDELVYIDYNILNYSYEKSVIKISRKTLKKPYITINYELNHDNKVSNTNLTLKDLGININSFKDFNINSAKLNETEALFMKREESEKYELLNYKLYELLLNQ